MYRTQSIVAYMGIPYAHAPVGDLRFSPPVIEGLTTWEGIRNGSISQANCFQSTKNPIPKHTQVLNKLLNKVMDMDDLMEEISSDQFSEDCLYLNVFVPDCEYIPIAKSMSFVVPLSVSSFVTRAKFIHSLSRNKSKRMHGYT
jgi:carboxylesterase type B